MLLELNANTQAIISTGKAVATANTTGSSQPPPTEADSGMSIPK